MITPIQLLRRIKRRFRAAVGASCLDDREIEYRLSLLPDTHAPGSRFAFPWGKIEYVSARTLQAQYREIYIKRHYSFQCNTATPIIIDAGGNIGMSAIWFKRSFPNSRLTVYEADPNLAATITRNMQSAGLTDVEVCQTAVWDKDGFVAFDNTGADKGAISSTGRIQVPSINLSSRIPQHVDMLKLDVEGAEYDIINRMSVEGTLSRIQHIVAEYHITRADVDRFLESLRLIRASGMQLAFSAELGPWIGLADHRSTIDVVEKQQILAEVYAWR